MERANQMVGTDGTVAAAIAGDEPAFAALAERHRHELHVHCYRMLASFDEAEDAVQETFLNAWRGRSGFEWSRCRRRYHDARSGVQRLPERLPQRPEILDDLARLLMADLDQFWSGVAAFPFDDGGSKRPAEVLPYALVGRAVVVLEAPDKPVGVIDGPVVGNDRVVGYRAWHLEPFLPTVGSLTAG
jgi:Sigma-70 region 2